MNFSLRFFYLSIKNILIFKIKKFLPESPEFFTDSPIVFFSKTIDFVVVLFIYRSFLLCLIQIKSLFFENFPTY